MPKTTCDQQACEVVADAVDFALDRVLKGVAARGGLEAPIRAMRGYAEALKAQALKSTAKDPEVVLAKATAAVNRRLEEFGFGRSMACTEFRDALGQNLDSALGIEAEEIEDPEPPVDPPAEPPQDPEPPEDDEGSDEGDDDDPDDGEDVFGEA